MATSPPSTTTSTIHHRIHLAPPPPATHQASNEGGDGITHAHPFHTPSPLVRRRQHARDHTHTAYSACTDPPQIRPLVRRCSAAVVHSCARRSLPTAMLARVSLVRSASLIHPWRSTILRWRSPLLRHTVHRQGAHHGRAYRRERQRRRQARRCSPQHAEGDGRSGRHRHESRAVRHATHSDGQRVGLAPRASRAHSHSTLTLLPHADVPTRLLCAALAVGCSRPGTPRASSAPWAWPPRT